jgi:hypothetical protein
MKKIIAIAAFVLAAAFSPSVSSAAGPEKPPLEVVLYDGLIGGAIGAVAGTATLAFMDHPGDHMNRVVQGAAIGTLCGMAFGFYEIRPVLYTYTDHSGRREMAYGLAVNLPLK